MTNNIITADVANRFNCRGKFFPQIDAWIEESDNFYSRKKAKVAFIKSYLLAATGASPYFSCAACGYPTAIASGARLLQTTPATVGLAFEAAEQSHALHHCLFMVDPVYVDPARLICQTNKYSEITRTRLSCRAGIGLLSLYREFANIDAGSILVVALNNYISSPLAQVIAAIRALDAELVAVNGNLALAAERVRHSPLEQNAGDFGKSVWKQTNQLLAGGHDPNV